MQRLLLALLACASLAGCSGCDGQPIIDRHYRQCLAVGGSYRQGDGLDDFSCTLATAATVR